jgi:Leucine-rich repeat (LRR) protein
LLLLVLVSACDQQLIEVECPDSLPTNCNCTEFEDVLDAECDFALIRIQVGEVIAIHCQEDVLEPPALLNVETSVRFIECPLPNNSYDSLLLGDHAINTLSLRHLRSANLACHHFEDMSNLTHLDLAFNNLTFLPEDLLIELDSLVSLDLSNNHLHIFPPGFFNTSTLLEKLYLDNNELEEISENLFTNASALCYLSLCRNKINNISSASFAGLVNLKYLDLSQNQIRRLLPDTFSELKSLKYIDLSENYFKRLHPLLFSGLKFLSQVKVDRNLKEFNMTDDTEWILGHEKELELPNFILSNLPRLQIISVSNSGLSQLPRFGFQYSKQISELYFRDNFLSTVPRFMLQDCVHLRVLDLSKNIITDLPTDMFSELQELRELRLDQNQLTRLPRSYTLYAELEELHLHNNNLTWLPYWLMRQLRHAPSLRLVTLADNPWQCDCRLRDLATFLRSNKSNVVVDAQHVKCDDGRRLMDLTDNMLCGFIDVD